MPRVAADSGRESCALVRAKGAAANASVEAWRIAGAFFDTVNALVTASFCYRGGGRLLGYYKGADAPGENSDT